MIHKILTFIIAVIVAQIVIAAVFLLLGYEIYPTNIQYYYGSIQATISIMLAFICLSDQ